MAGLLGHFINEKSLNSKDSTISTYTTDYAAVPTKCEDSIIDMYQKGIMETMNMIYFGYVHALLVSIRSKDMGRQCPLGLVTIDLKMSFIQQYWLSRHSIGL